MIEPSFRRRKPAGFNIADIPVGAYAAGAAMLILMLGMWCFSKPSGAKARMAALEQQALVIKAAEKTQGDLQTYPLGSVCTEDLGDAFRNRLSASLLNSGVKIEALDVSDDGPTDGIHPLRAYTLTLKASGGYEQAVGALNILAQYQPTVFLDSMHLRNQTSSVDLNVEGRLYCRLKKQG